MTGIISALISTIFAASKDLLSKKLAGLVHGNVSAFASFIYAIPWYILFMCIAYMAGFPVFEFNSAFLLYVLLRAVTDTFAEFFKMHALAKGDISFIANFLSLAPVFLLFTAPLITGESISGIGLAGVILVCIGTVAFVYHPMERKAGIPWTGVGLAILSSIFFSLNSCFDRLSVQEGSPLFSGFSMTVLSMLFLGPTLFFVKNKKGQFSSNSSIFHLRGLFEVLFMTTKLIAMQFMEPQYVVGIGKLGLVMSILGGGYFYKEKGTLRRMLISGIIVLGSVMIIVNALG
jgi:uncharacterized membrane protein